MALTATSTPEVKKAILNTLCLQEDDTTIVARVPDRPNIFLGKLVRASSETIAESLKDVIDHIRVKQAEAKKMFVFCRSINVVSDVWHAMLDELQDAAYVDGVKDSDHIHVEMFHNSTGQASKARILEKFRKSDSSIRCLVSTVAMGMGINIRDVDAVIHYGCPSKVVNYWQEVGRGGRDGRPAYALIIGDRFTMAACNTSKEMKEICSEKESCLREKILANFLISGSKPSMQRTDRCSQCTADRCQCTLCTCCCNCL